MRKLLFFLCFLSSAFYVSAQTVVQQTPQNVQLRIFNAVNTAQTGTVTRNIGQNVHLITYITSGTDATTRLRVRIEASNDGTNFFAISDDATDIASGSTISFGYFPVLRVNLVSFAGAGTLTLHYAGTNSVSEPPSGIFNSSQSYRRVLSFNQTGAVDVTFNPAFGSLGGWLHISCSPAPAAGTTLTVNAITEGGLGAIGIISNMPVESVLNLVDVPPLPAKQVRVILTDPTSTCSISYFSVPVSIPALPADALNSAGTQSPYESPVVCARRANIAVTGAGDTQIIADAAGVSGVRVVICHISFALSVAVNVKLTEGTGANCVTGTTDITGVYQNVSALGLDFGPNSPLRSSRDVAVCLNLSGAATGGGVVLYSYIRSW